MKTTTSGTAILTGTEVVAGNVIGVTYYSTTGQFQLVTNNINVATPPGQIATYGMTSCPSGWLAANGSAVSRSTYAILFSTIGSSWGNGDGSTTFNLPDLRGTFVRGTGTNGTYGTAVGQAVGSYAADTYLNHSHTATSTDAGHTHSYTTPGGNYSGGSPGSSYTLTSNAGTTSTGTGYASISTTVATSTTGDTETKPKNYGVLYCIKF